MTIISDTSTAIQDWSQDVNGVKDPVAEPEPAAKPAKAKQKMKPQTDLSNFPEKAVSFLKANPGWKTTKQILAETYPTAHPTSAQKYLRNLVKEGKIRTSMMKNTHHFKYMEYKMTDPEASVVFEPAKPLFTISYFPDHAEMSLADASSIVDALKHES